MPYIKTLSVLVSVVHGRYLLIKLAFVPLVICFRRPDTFFTSLFRLKSFEEIHSKLLV
jgi:hypothetical protein